MSKSILYVYFGGEIDSLTVEYLLEKGHTVAIHGFQSKDLDCFHNNLSSQAAPRCHMLKPGAITESTVDSLVEEAREKVGEPEVLILGCPTQDEAEMLPYSWMLGEGMVDDFTGTFLIIKEVTRLMARKKAGQVVFLLLHDALHYAGYATAPVATKGRTVLMKSLAKELASLYINVNALVLGAMGGNMTPAEKKKLRKRLGFFALKPPLPAWSEVTPFLDLLVDPPVRSWTGQVVHVTPCGE